MKIRLGHSEKTRRRVDLEDAILRQRLDDVSLETESRELVSDRAVRPLLGRRLYWGAPAGAPLGRLRGSAPSESGDANEFMDSQLSAFRPRLGAWAFETLQCRFSRRFPNDLGFVALVEDHEEYSVPFLSRSQRAEALTGTSVRFQHATFNLVPSARCRVDGIPAGLTYGCELEPKQPHRLVLCNLTGDAERASRECEVSLREELRLREDANQIIWMRRSHVESV